MSPSAPSKRPTDTREAILQAALELFVAGGFHGTAVPQVAERAHVAAGTIYRHFASKEALVNELYRKLKGEMTAAVLSDVSVTKQARELFRGLWNRMADWARDHPQAFAFLELHHHRSYLDAQSRAVEERLAQVMTALVEPLQQREAIKPYPPMLLISLVLGAFAGMIRASWEGRLALTPENVAAAERCCWELVRS